MESRGRKHTVRENVIAFPVAKPARSKKRKPPAPAGSAPAYLTKEQAAIWREIIATKPADWFDADSAPLLAAYVRAVASCNRLARIVDDFERSRRFDSDALRAYSAALTAQERASKVLISLATKMRLTQQSRYRADEAERRNRNAPKAVKKPWETE